jgi:homoserine dehydrogenase
MIYHAFGVFVQPNEIPLQGINYLNKKVVEFAQQHQLKIKLIGEAQRTDGVITAKVEPQFIDTKHDFYNVENEYNGVLIDAEYTGAQFVKGKGAGSFPTALAVLSNLNDIKYNLSISKTSKKKVYKYSQLNVNEMYFIGGFEDDRDLKKLNISEQDSGSLIAKASLTTLKTLKQQHPNLYWVQIPTSIYEKIKKQEVLL